MLYGVHTAGFNNNDELVLILIFLENALRHSGNYRKSYFFKFVLILIFLENALRHKANERDYELNNSVLILIFLENALRL